MHIELQFQLYINIVSTWKHRPIFNVAYSKFFQHFNVGYHSTFKFWFELIQRWTIDVRSRLKICCMFNVFSTLKISTFNQRWIIAVQRCSLYSTYFIVETMLRACWERFPSSKIISRNFLLSFYLQYNINRYFPSISFSAYVLISSSTHLY